MNSSSSEAAAAIGAPSSTGQCVFHMMSGNS